MVDAVEGVVGKEGKGHDVGDELPEYRRCYWKLNVMR